MCSTTFELTSCHSIPHGVFARACVEVLFSIFFVYFFGDAHLRLDRNAQRNGKLKWNTAIKRRKTNFVISQHGNRDKFRSTQSCNSSSVKNEVNSFQTHSYIKSIVEWSWASRSRSEKRKLLFGWGVIIIIHHAVHRCLAKYIIIELNLTQIDEIIPYFFLPQIRPV